MNTVNISTATAADELLNAFQDVGISYLFCNLGSDHPSIIEGLAKAKLENKQLPKAIICPHESVAMAAAQGHTMLSGQTQGVVIHNDVGTQNLGGSVHNAFRARIPVFIFAGETPFTMSGELPGTRNSYVNYLQNVYDQRGIIRSYVKWESDLRTGKNIRQLVYRATQMAETAPAGPVYLTGAREILEERVVEQKNTWNEWNCVAATALPQQGVEEIIQALLQAEAPLLITSYVGKTAQIVDELVRFCEKFAIPVIEQIPTYVNFPRNHDLHAGYEPHAFVKQADVIIALDTDVPWVMTQAMPKEDCSVYYIDIDPVKENMPLWHIPTMKNYRAEALEALQQLNAYAEKQWIDASIEQRYARLKQKHLEERQSWMEETIVKDDDIITPAYVTACLSELVDDETIILDETITNTMTVCKHLPRSKPATYFTSGGTSLGWNGGAAVGMKLAQPEKQIINLTGDGTYLFSEPAAVHWMSRRYQAPFLTVIYNNEGWNATKMNLLKRYPDGIAKQTDQYWVNFNQSAELAKIAEAAGGVFAQTVRKPSEVRDALKLAMEKVKNGQSAIVDMRLAAVSQQSDF